MFLGGVEILIKTVILAAVMLASVSAAHAQSWTGKASYYRARHHMTCAHRSLPFGTQVRVTNLENQRSAVLVVADRGPFIKGRIVDVSTQAADRLGFRRAGVVKVAVETVSN
jgi:rare lipoprotein A